MQKNHLPSFPIPFLSLLFVPIFLKNKLSCRQSVLAQTAPSSAVIHLFQNVWNPGKKYKVQPDYWNDASAITELFNFSKIMFFSCSYAHSKACVIWINVIKVQVISKGYVAKPVAGKFVVTEGVLEFGGEEGLKEAARPVCCWVSLLWRFMWGSTRDSHLSSPSRH